MSKQFTLSKLIASSQIRCIIKACSRTSGLNIRLINERGESIDKGKLPGFCEIINHNEDGSRICLEFYADTLKKLSLTKKGSLFTCPAGNLFLIVPIMLKDVLLGGIVSEGMYSENKLLNELAVKCEIDLTPLPIDAYRVNRLPKGRLNTILRDMEDISKLISELYTNKFLLEQKNTEIAAINHISKTLISHVDLKNVLSAIVDGAAKTLNTKKCSLRLFNHEKTELIMTVSCGLSKRYLYKRHEIKIGKSIVGRVAETKMPVIVEDVRTNSLLENPQQVINEGIISFLSVPLLMKNTVLGVLTVYSQTPHKYTIDEIQLLSSLAVQSAIAIENKRLVAAIKTNLINITRSLAEAIEAKDIHTRGHSERTVWYAVSTAREMGMTESAIETLEIATLLHDIGKIGVPEEILLKPGGLTQEEFGKIRNHPTTSLRILSSGEFPDEIVVGVSQHHERMDGKGYPHGLSGDEISLEARIIEVADSFEAMVSNRPYRKALDVETAIMELKRCSGKQFDPEVVNAFLRVLEKRKERFGVYI
ncbi:HD domain-containing protein [Candidatus Desantisbacteria bacterium]|nr:HD domain-containing protein [Candidatus Desantisbacteria bacterium]